MAILVEGQLHSGACDKQLKRSYSQATIPLMHPRGNCYIRELDPSHIGAQRGQGRHHLFWKGPYPPWRGTPGNSWTEENP